MTLNLADLPALPALLAPVEALSAQECWEPQDREATEEEELG